MNENEWAEKHPGTHRTSETLSKGDEQKIYAEQVKMLYTGATFGALASFAGALIFVFISWGSVNWQTLFVWLTSILLITTFRLVLISSYKWHKPPPEEAAKWAFRYLLSTMGAGLAWGAAGLFLFAGQPITNQVFLFLVVGGLSAGTVFTYSPVMPVFLAFTVPAVFSMSTHALFILDDIHLGMGFMGELYLITLIFMARNSHRVIRNTLKLSLENKELVEHLRESKEKYKSLFKFDNSILECSPVGIVKLGPDLTIEYMNPAMKIMSGVPEGEEHMAIGDKLTDISSVISAGFTTAAKKLKEGEEVELEAPFRTLYEKDLFLSIKAVPLLGNEGFGGAIIIISDITARKIAEDALKKSEQKLSLHAQQTAVGMIEWDVDFKVTAWNPAAEKIFGFTKDEAMGCHPYELIVPASLKEYLNTIWANLLRGKGGERSINENITKDGRTITCEWNNTPLVNNEGNVVAVASFVQNITEHKEAEESLKKFTSAINQSGEAIFVIDPETTSFLYVNETACKSLGYSRSELLNMGVMEIETTLSEESLWEEHLKLIKKADSVVLEGEHKRKDETVFPVEVNAKYVSEGSEHYIVVAARDITERLKTERELRQLTNAIDQSDRMVVITDRDGVIEYVNPAVTKNSLYSQEELIGKSTRIFKSGEHDHDMYKDLWDTILMGETWSSRIINRRKNGELYYEGITISPVKNDKDVITNFVAVKSDITDRILAEEELKNARAMAEEAALAAEKANTAKSDFLAHMSHELRTPLNGILGLAEITLKSPLDEEQYKHLEMIRHSGKKLLNLVNDILDLARVEAGKVEILNLEFDLRETIGRISEHFSITAEVKGIKFSSYIAEDIPEAVIGDQDKIWQIIINLIGNAIKFTKKGSVTIGITVANRVDDLTTIHFCVQDTGIGIAKERQSKIFERFTQEDSSITKVYGGAGLGTTISKQLVQIMGGSIWFESEPGKGSAFHFTIPFETSKLKVPDMAGEGSSAEDDLPFQYKGPLNILLAEDNIINQEVASSALRLLGHTVTVAQSGREAVELWEKGGSDLILMDVEMPDMDGFEATKLIREREKDARIPIIAMTARVMRGDRDECIAAGMDEHIPKPITVESLRTAINKTLKASNKVKVTDEEKLPNSKDETTGEEKPVDLNSDDDSLYDLSAITQIMEGDKAQVDMLMEKFVQVNNATLSDLDGAIKSGDVDKIRFFAHAIKGSSMQIMANRTAKIASLIEILANLNQLEQIPEKFKALTKEYTALTQKLKADIDAANQ